MINLRDTFDRVLTESGQYLFTLDNIEVRTHNFVHLIRSTLHDVNKYQPHEAKLFANILGSREHTFTNLTKDNNGNEVGIPSYIPDIFPVRTSGTVPFLLRSQNRIPGTFLEEKLPLPFQYNAPILTVSVSAEYNIDAVFRHTLEVESDADEEDPRKWLMRNMTVQDGDFFNLLTARFMKAVGRSRRAFTIEDLPITVDAAELVSDGKEKEAEAIESLQNNASINIGMGG